jgi:molybdopterin-guanine dinucleotide biosynthesis protein B
MNIYGIIGWKNAGKTTLITGLVTEFTARGLRVSTVKHSHHAIAVDPIGTDSHLHRVAGAHQTILASPQRFALLQDHKGAEPDLSEILNHLAPVDLILVEGYKSAPHRKIEVHRHAAGHALISDPHIRAVATDATFAALKVPQLDLDDIAAIADFIQNDLGLAV